VTALNGPVAFDIETPSAKELFTFRSRPEALYARLNGALDGSGTEVLTADPVELVRLLSAAPEIHAHNGYRFDLMALAFHHGADYDALAPKLWDTYVDATVLDPPGSKGQKPWANEGYYGLDQLAARLGLPGKTDHLPELAKEYAAEGLTGKAAEEDGYGKIPVTDERYRSYLSGDLRAQSAVSAALLTNPERMDYRCREQRVAYIQNRMTLSGWKVDVPLLARLVTGEREKVRESLDWLHENAGVPLTKTVSSGRGKNKIFREEPHLSPLTTGPGREALKAAFRDRGLPYYLETASGALALGKDALSEGSYMVGKGAGGSLRPGLFNPERIARTPGADWEALREMAGHIKLVTTAVQKYEEIQNHLIGDRVHAKVGETQGSRRWAMVTPSLTNLGKRDGKHVQRAPLIADDGCVLICFDFDQVDMRAIAGHCGDAAYVDMFVQGQDPHSMIANMVFGAEGCACPDKTKHTCEKRDRAKASGHGWNYGLSVNGMVNSGIDRVLAERFDAGMNEGYPDLCAWRTKVREKAAAGELLPNGFGGLLRCDPARAWTQAPAQPGQGTARDIMCEGLLRLPEEYIPWARGVVHDEAVFNVPEDRVEECIEVVTQAFTMDLAEVTQGRLHSVPIVAGASKPGHNWSECYQK
jgi:DNA polymerase family A